eukprot:11790849-Heterocapsa_arctica.AAC.1
MWMPARSRPRGARMRAASRAMQLMMGALAENLVMPASTPDASPRMRMGPRHGPSAHARRASRSAYASHVACDPGDPISALSSASSSGVHAAEKYAVAAVQLV